MKCTLLVYRYSPSRIRMIHKQHGYCHSISYLVRCSLGDHPSTFVAGCSRWNLTQTLRRHASHTQQDGPSASSDMAAATTAAAAAAADDDLPEDFVSYGYSLNVDEGIEKQEQPDYDKKSFIIDQVEPVKSPLVGFITDHLLFSAYAWS